LTLGCSDKQLEHESLASRTAALVGAQFPVSVPAIFDGGQSVSGGRVACETSGRCVVLYQQINNNLQLLIRRFNTQGAIDPGLIEVASNVGGFGDTTIPASIASRGDGEYLVTWRTKQAVFATRFDATTGKVLDKPPLALGTLAKVSDFLSVAGTPGGYAILYNDTAATNPKQCLLRIVGGALLETVGIPVCQKSARERSSEPVRSW